MTPDVEAAPPTPPVEPAPRPGVARRLYDWVLSLADRPNAAWWLAGISFAEASFFPIPPDVLLIPLCLGAGVRAMKFAAICSVASVLGGMLGYLIGWGFWAGLDDFFYAWIPGFSEEKFVKFEDLYSEYGVMVVFLAGFSPIPYEIFTIASGVASMAFLPFVAASAVSRSARFFLVAAMLRKYGAPMRRLIDRHFNKVALAFGLLLVGGFVAAKMLLH